MARSINDCMTTYTIKRALFAITISVIVVSCAKEADQQPQEQEHEELHEMVFHAGLAPETKTFLQEDGSVWWSPGDEISLFVGNSLNGGYRMIATNTEPAATADFVGQIGGSGSKYIAIFPYNETNQVDGNNISFTVPTEQIAKEGTFAEGAFVSVAVSSDENLYFKNLCSGIKFSVANDNINKIVIKSRAGSGGIAGWVSNITLTDAGEPTTDLWGGSISLVISNSDGGCFKPGSYYYASIIPGTKSTGVEIDYITTDNKVGTFIYDNPVTFHRAKVKRLFEKDKDLQFYPYHENKAKLYAYALLPEGVDKTVITNVSFIVNTDKTTDTPIYTDSQAPIYFELDGTTAKYYTSAEVYDLRNAINMFLGWSSLIEIDLSNIETMHVTDMKGMFAGCESLTHITFGDFHTENVISMGAMFAECWSLESLDLSGFQTGRVTNMSEMFGGCSSLKTLDLSSFDTSNVENMESMFGRSGAIASDTYTWRACRTGCSSLESLDLHTFNTSKVNNLGGMFSLCYNLKNVNLSGWDTSSVETLGSMFEGCTSIEEVDVSSFDTRNVMWMGHMFENCTSLASLDLSNFETPNVTSMQNMFYGCESLQSLDIRNFDSASLTDAMQFLVGAHSLKQLNLGTFDISRVDNLETPFNGVAKQSKNIAIKCIEETKQTIVGLANYYFDLDYVTWVGIDEPFPSLAPDEIDSDLYYSSDFSMDKKVLTIQNATIGNGIDIVIMGDAYSDRLIADGTYEGDMREAIEALFSVEPMKSYRHLFNVYMVYAVSDNEVNYGSTVFRVQSYGDHVMGDVLMSNVYTKMAVHNKPFSDVATIVIGHDTNAFIGELGTTAIGYVFNGDQYCDYGGGAEWNAAYVGRWDATTYEYTTVHEFGHLFAKLADEYVTKDETIGEFNEYEIPNLEWNILHGGLYKNIDFTNDPETIKWSKFLNDSRYSSENLGAYEGGLLYSRGVWRPSEDSIMRNAWTKFNAPSREAIYNRIHKLAYGDSWQYDYETFVQQDLNNISQSAPAPLKRVSSPIKFDSKPFFKIEESTSSDGKKMVTLIMN